MKKERKRNKIILTVTAIIIVIGVGCIAGIYTGIYKNATFYINKKTSEQDYMHINYTVIDVPSQYNDYPFELIDKMINEVVQVNGQAGKSHTAVDKNAPQFIVQDYSAKVNKSDYLLIKDTLGRKGM